MTRIKRATSWMRARSVFWPMAEGEPFRVEGESLVWQRWGNTYVGTTVNGFVVSMPAAPHVFGNARLIPATEGVDVAQTGGAP